MNRRTTSGRDGFILVSTLAALIVLASLVAGVSYLVRAVVVGAASKRAELGADALVAAGVELAGYQLFSLKRSPEAINGQQIRFNDGVVTMFAQAEAGKIDLNGAPAQLLASAWASIGAPDMTPESFAARVVDYRDPDSKTSEGGGAEAAQYSVGGISAPPANAPFEQIDELQRVLGVSTASVFALKPLLTVHNPGGKISAYAAPAAVIRALPDGARLLDQLLALRAMPRAPSGQQGGSDKAVSQIQEAFRDQAQFLSFEPTSAAYTVRIEVERSGARRAETRVLTASKSRDALYFVTERVVAGMR